MLFSSAVELPGLPPQGGGSEADLSLELARTEDVRGAFSGPAPEPAVASAMIDGLPYRAERGVAGDHLITHGQRAAFHISPAADLILCAPADPAEPLWRRTLLDSVLATASLARGFEALHAAAVAAPGGVVAFMAATGGGKTTLACELVRRGLPLVCDDVLALERDAHGKVIAHPAPPLVTVPRGADAPAGRTLAELGEESWIAVEHAATEPAPVAAVCLLDRRAGLEPGARAADKGVVDLLAHALRSGSAPERMQARFELLADLAEQAPAFVLEADPATAPARLADLAEAAIPALQRLPTQVAR